MIAQPPTDAELLRGGEEEFARLVERYNLRLDRFLARFSAEPASRQDLAQEVFLKMYRARDTFQQGQPFAPWFFRIALNAARDFRRSALRRERCFSPQEMNEERAQRPAGPSAESALLAREKGARLRQLVQTLPAAEQEALWLFYGAGLGQEEIALALGVSKSTVNNWLFRAREQLRSAAQNEGLWESGR